ncbi:ribose 5-phosphate isomerase [Mycobacterium tuberculosis]|nr:ribose 5-phosphate isomerase [Mycobacterium tuberculosis]
MSGMRVYLGADHAGYELKQRIIEHLKQTGHEPPPIVNSATRTRACSGAEFTIGG